MPPAATEARYANGQVCIVSTRWVRKPQSRQQAETELADVNQGQLIREFSAGFTSSRLAATMPVQKSGAIMPAQRGAFFGNIGSETA